MTALTSITKEQYVAAIRAGGRRARIAQELISPFRRFRPRPDNIGLRDQQTGFSGSTASVCIALGGNGSGKTVTAAHKVARHLRFTPPPRLRTPYWVIGETYELACGVAWLEKLSKFIPATMIADVDWYRKTRQWPYAVMLKHPTMPGKVGWVIEFKSFKQGRERFQAASIGGGWFNEQSPMTLVREVKARTRDYNSQLILDFTPLAKDIEWPMAYDDPPPGWEFFHMNTECNTALPAGWAADFLAGIPSDERETRRIGVFGSFTGAVFRDFNRRTNVVEPFEIPASAKRFRGIDFGYTAPFACVWWCRLPHSIPLPDGRLAREGTWVCYREYVKTDTLLREHARAIKDAETWGGDTNVFGNTVADHDSQDAAELKAEGVRTIPADKGENSVDVGLYAMKKLMVGGTDLYAPKFLVFSTCKRVVAELQSYAYDPATKTHDSRGVPLKKDDHTIDASRYALAHGLRNFGEFPKEASGNTKEAPWRHVASGFIGA